MHLVREVGLEGVSLIYLTLVETDKTVYPNRWYAYPRGYAVGSEGYTEGHHFITSYLYHILIYYIFLVLFECRS
jgi:hypothetical protein